MPLIILAAAGILLAVLERIPGIRFTRSPLLRRYLPSDTIYLITGFLFGRSLSAAYLIAGMAFAGGTLGLPRISSLNLPLWASIPLATVVFDLGQYFVHYVMHRSDVIWEFHKIHHSTQVLDWMATFRSHIVEQILRRVVGPLFLIMIGFDMRSTLIASGIYLAFAEFNHSNLRVNLRFLEPIFITPALHRAHHIFRTQERNLGTIFSFWDRMRGTLVQVDATETTPLGNGEPTYPQSWLPQFIEPFLRILRIRKASYQQTS